MKNKKRVTLSLILTFLLTLVVFVIGQFAGLSLGLFHKETFLKTLLDSGYYREVSEDLDVMTTDVLEHYRLPSELSGDLWKQAEIHADMEDYVNAWINGNEDTSHFPDQVKERMIERLDAYYTQAKLQMKEEEWQRTKMEIVNMIAYHYESRLHLPLLNEYIGFCDRMNRFTLPVIVIGGGVAIFISVFLCLPYHHKHKGVRHIAYAMVGASFITMLAGYFVKNEMLVDQRFISDAAYRKLCNAIVANGWNYVNMIGIIGIVLGALLFFLVALIRRKGKLTILNNAHSI